MINSLIRGGNVATLPAANVTGDLSVGGDADVAGDIDAATIGGTAEASVLAGAAAANAATSANTASRIVARDGSGNFSAGTITAALTGAVNGLALRKIGSGQTTCNNATTTTLGTFTRNAGEVVVCLVFPVTDAAIDWAEDESASTSAAIHYTRTTNSNEFSVKVANTSGSNRAFDWIVIGVS